MKFRENFVIGRLPLPSERSVCSLADLHILTIDLVGDVSNRACQRDGTNLVNLPALKVCFLFEQLERSQAVGKHLAGRMSYSQRPFKSPSLEKAIGPGVVRVTSAVVRIPFQKLHAYGFGEGIA